MIFDPFFTTNFAGKLRSFGQGSTTQSRTRRPPRLMTAEPPGQASTDSEEARRVQEASSEVARKCGEMSLITRFLMI